MCFRMSPSTSQGRPRRVRRARIPAQRERLRRPGELRPPPPDTPGQPGRSGGGGPVRAAQAGLADVHAVSGCRLCPRRHSRHLEAGLAAPDIGDSRGGFASWSGGLCGEAAAAEGDGAAAADRGVDDLAGRQLRRHGGRHQGSIAHTCCSSLNLFLFAPR